MSQEQCCKKCGKTVTQILSKKGTQWCYDCPCHQKPNESWEVEFKDWYVSIYPANWKAHKVVEKIKDLLANQAKEMEKVVVPEKKDRPSDIAESYSGGLDEGAVLGFNEAISQIKQNFKNL